MENYIFGMLYILVAVGVVILALSLTDIVLCGLLRIPFIRRKINTYFEEDPFTPDERW